MGNHRSTAGEDATVAGRAAEGAPKRRAPTHRVTLKALSAVHVREGESFRMEAPPDFTGPIRRVAYQSEYRSHLPTLLVADVFVVVPGSGEDAVQQAVDAATIVTHDFHLLGVVFNAAVHEPEVTGVYELRSGGAFLQQSMSTTRPHGDFRAREASAEALGLVLGVPRPLPSRLETAVSLYDYSLCALHPFRTLEAGLRMYPSVENISKYIQKKTREEAQLTKAEHAESLGVDLSLSDWESHYLGAVRRHHVFIEDATVFAAVRNARNDYEHASADFDALRARIKPILGSLYKQVRRAIVAQLGLTQEALDIILRPEFDEPLGSWGTRLGIEGTVAGSAEAFGVESRRIEISFDPSSASFEETDRPDDAGFRKGQLRFTMGNTILDLPDGAQLSVTGTRASSPQPWRDEPSEPQVPAIQNVTLNGVDVTDQALGIEPRPDT